jgi:hypothetical protein
MENCSLYFHRPDYDGIIAKVEQAFPQATLQFTEEDGSRVCEVTTGGGLFSRKQQLTVKYRQRLNPSYKIEKVECPMTQQLAGMYNFVASLPATDTALRSKFLQKIQTVNVELVFMTSPKLGEFRELLEDIAQTYDAFLFVQPGHAIAQSKSQHFLDKSFRLLIDTTGKCGNGTVTVQIDPVYFDDQRPATPDQAARKQRTEQLLLIKGVTINAHLPYTEPEAEVMIRPQQEIIERMYALTQISAKGEGVPMDQLQQMREKINIQGFSPQEERIYNTPILNDQDKANATWRYESLNVMLWVLGLTDELVYPSTICDVPKIVGIVIGQSRASLQKSVKLRSKSEILEELDQAYRMHWACVQARITKQQPGGDLMDGVVYERHYALNWVTCYQDQAWDDVSTDT